MSEEEIVRHCAPTLAGLKTGNMFSTEYTALGKINRKNYAVICRTGGYAAFFMPVGTERTSPGNV